MNRDFMKRYYLVFFIVLVSLNPIFAGEGEGEIPPIHYKEMDRCPVCNMFVAKYPEWVAQIVFKDGSYVVFDGSRDMFTYYFNLERYNPKKTRADIKDILVTEYYDVKPIRARDAFFVIGSDVLGPMGRELIPFESLDAALEFKRDHKGEKILRFDEVNNALIEEMRKGQTISYKNHLGLSLREGEMTWLFSLEGDLSLELTDKDRDNGKKIPICYLKTDNRCNPTNTFFSSSTNDLCILCSGYDSIYNPSYSSLVVTGNILPYSILPEEIFKPPYTTS